MATFIMIWLILATVACCVSFIHTDWRTASTSSVIRQALMIYFFFPIALFYLLITLSKH